MTMQLAGATDMAGSAARALPPHILWRPAGSRAEPAVPCRPQPAPEAPRQTTKPAAPISTEELAEMLRRVNLTFDLFEIAAKYAVDKDGGQIRVTLFNTRTGEIIRRIPPGEFQAGGGSLREGLGLQFNRCC